MESLSEYFRALDDGYIGTTKVTATPDFTPDFAFFYFLDDPSIVWR
jgi:hypothetical protein